MFLDDQYSCSENVTVIKRHSDNKDAFLSELITCGVIIYDITQDPGQIEEACWILKEIVRTLEGMEKKSPKAFEREEPTRHFILISTIMTWARSKPLDPRAADLPFTEAGYRKRKAHPNYKEHMRCEREFVAVMKIANLKNKLKIVVICCGITYGEEQGPLHYLFKMAWQNAPFLPVFGNGQNLIPLLHVRDLASTVSAVVQNWPPVSYIVAVERKLISQDEIVKCISRGLATGKIKSVTKEEALSIPEVSQHVYDQMTVNLNVNPVYINDRIQWHFGLPFQDVIDAVVEEYKSSRGLRPVKIIVLGPPASGKTRIARYLADHYGIHYVHVKTLISDTIQKLVDDIETAKSDEGRQDDLKDTTKDDTRERDREEQVKGERKEKEAVVKKLQKQLDEIRANMAANNGRLDDIVLTKLFLNRLKSKDCLNQGYVMDGHPKTLEQARMLFLIGEKDLDKGEEVFEDDGNVNWTILPELVVVLEASDEFLKERVMNLPESEIQDTRYTEEHMLRRLREYRERNTDDNTPLQLFDEMEIHPVVIFVEADTCPDMFPTVYQCLEKLGKPRNYGPTAEEMEAARKRAEAKSRAAEAAEKLQREREISECKRLREQKMIEWENLAKKLKAEEEERLCILAEPMQKYLAKYVLPTLTQALIEVAELRPEDPIDFLAEYLFKKNPEGKMFEPDYSETMSMLLDAIGRQQSDILPQEDLKTDAAQYLDTVKKIEKKKNRTQDVCAEI
ncbi:adenylate kinase 7-like isoform X2 [Pseudomyrmex gracilis]|uniref:adenylate kinase 7-like isoform X2 n=1 Tax=Pseudomyrmex gracilis TaxID=219809 RepID=UPI00099528E2|nr:adenylate kinase 7-like isoform X2 [Pseudomyrmex gracilis]